MTTARIKLTALLVLTFIAGGAGGIAIERAWLNLAPAEDGGGETTESGFTIERFADDLNLSAEQRTEIEGMLTRFRASWKQMWDEFRPRYSTLVDSVRLEIESVLTPEQVEQYRNLLREQYDAGAFGAQPTD